MNEAPTWEESTAVATDEAPRWEDSTPVDIPHWDDSTPVGESTSDTPATDSALKKLNRLAQTPSPDWMQGFEGAVKDLVKGVPEMAMQLPKAAYQGVKFAAGGPQERAQVAGEVLKQAVPMGEQIAQGIQQPIGSKEWWSSALQMGMMAAPALELLRPAEAIKPPIQEGATDAIKRSDAQVQARETPLGEQARPEGQVPQPSSSYYAVGETQGTTPRGNIPGEEPVSTGESVADETQKENAPRVARIKTDYGKRIIEKREGDLYDDENDDDLAFDRGGVSTGKITKSKAKQKYGRDYEVGQKVVTQVLKDGKTIYVDEVIDDPTESVAAETPEEPHGTRSGDVEQPQIPEGSKANVQFKTESGEMASREMDAREAEGIFTKERSSYKALLDCLSA